MSANASGCISSWVIWSRTERKNNESANYLFFIADMPFGEKTFNILMNTIRCSTGECHFSHFCVRSDLECK